MSRPLRIDFHGAVHLVHVRGRDRFSIYFDASVLNRAAVDRWRSVPHLLQFFELLDDYCSECGVQLFGYCMEPNDASLLLQTLGAPLDALMQRLSGRYSRYLHAERVVPKSVSPFATRYESKVLAPEYLPHALRRVHARAVHSGLARKAADYPFSSAPAYVGLRPPVHLETDAARRALERKGMFGFQGYRQFMEQPEVPHVTKLFEQGSQLDSRIVARRVFAAQARDAAGHPPAPVTREQLLAAVAKVLETEPAALCAADHQAVLGRALVAWYAQRLGTASLREVGTWFHVSAAALGKGIRHYRRVSPKLFERTTLPGIQPADSALGDGSD